MAAAPQKATFSFAGASGRTYNVAGYVSDVVGANVTFNPNGAAASTSLNYWQAPEQVVLKDVAFVTGLTDTVGINLTSGGANVPSSTILYTTCLTTTTNRQPPVIGFRAGSLVGAVQF